jgi:threonyl-tRNA synthetase
MSDPITVTLPDGSSRELPAGSTAGDLAAAIGPRLAKAAIAATADGHEIDLSSPLADGATVAILTPDSDEGRYVVRHSTAHVLAQAVLELWPGAKFAIGPPVADGFYYDFELPDGAHFTDDDLERIDARMRDIVAAGQPFLREEHSIDDGLALFADQPYKVEIIQGVAGGDGSDMDASEGAEAGVVTAYRNTDQFVDLCRGPHVPSTKRLGHFKLLRVAGAYWRGDEKRAQLQRIYGTAWESDAALKDHLHRLEEAEKRDHRKLGRELDLFSLPPELGQGLVLYHPNGAVVRRELVRYAEDLHERRGYRFVSTPHVARSELWQTSGHLDKYRDSMYPGMELDEGLEYRLKPMNCPFHVYVYKSRQRSYRDLPLRLFELGTVYRHEKSGVLHGVQRPRGFTQDDSHIFCTPDQLVDELNGVMDLVVEQYEPFGFGEPEIKLSTSPGEAIGTAEMWERATDVLRSALEKSGRSYTVAAGEGAFYGPKIDFDFRDAIGRAWQLTTVQCDFALPERFGLEYVGADNQRHRPVMIHRAIYGSLERFLATFIEHTAGAFPAWLAPIQVQVLPVAEEHRSYAESVMARLADGRFRVELVDADEPLGARIRAGKLQKVPYILVVGGDDVAAGTVGVNRRGENRPERDVALDAFVARLAGEVATKARD